MVFPSQSLVIAACQLGSAGSLPAKPRRRGRSIPPCATLRHLAAVTAKLAFRHAPAMRRLVVAARMARAAPRSASFSIISARAAIKRPDQTGKAETYRNAPSYLSAL